MKNEKETIVNFWEFDEYKIPKNSKRVIVIKTIP